MGEPYVPRTINETQNKEEKERFFLHLSNWQARKGDNLSDKDNSNKICHNNVIHKMLNKQQEQKDVMRWVSRGIKNGAFSLYFSHVKSQI